MDANLRIRVFNSTNKLYPEKPVQAVQAGKGSFKYYWFLSTGAMEAAEALNAAENKDEVENSDTAETSDTAESMDAAATLAYWQHAIAMGIKTSGADFDLYVSVMDGRYPTDTDFDFSSTNYGADSIFLSSNDPMFQRTNPNSWNPAVGMVVVIGVKSL